MDRKKIINDYILAYNNFDIERMLANLDDHLKFENISNGVTDLTLTDLSAFRKQAEQVKNLFIKRTQIIKSWKQLDDLIEIEIEYNAVVASDLPNGLKKGLGLNLQGKSVFKFLGNKIVQLTDIS